MVEVWIDWKGLKRVGTLHRSAGRGRERVAEATIAWRDVARALGAPEREIRDMATAFEHEEADLARA